jgi:hypothetical protein
MKQNTKNLVGIGAIAAAGFLLAKQIARTVAPSTFPTTSFSKDLSACQVRLPC